MTHKARINEQALFGAAERGDVRTVQRLLKPRWLQRKPNLEVRNPDGWTALHQASAYGQLAVVRLLLSQGAQVGAHNYLGLTPLHYAACYGHEEVARLLVARGARHTPHTAAALGEEQAVARLLEEGNDHGARDYFGYTPLHWAARHGRLGATRALLDAGADPQATDVNGETPLHRAQKWEHLEVAELLRQATRFRQQHLRRLA
jgi:ankyrin repeat protein